MKQGLHARLSSEAKAKVKAFGTKAKAKKLARKAM